MIRNNIFIVSFLILEFQQDYQAYKNLICNHEVKEKM